MFLKRKLLIFLIMHVACFQLVAIDHADTNELTDTTDFVNQASEALFFFKVDQAIEHHVSLLLQIHAENNQAWHAKLSHIKKILHAITPATSLANLKSIFNSIQLLVSKKSEQSAEEYTIFSYLAHLILLKTTPVLMQLLEKELLVRLEQAETRLRYWIEQQAHPVYYALHKSPRKWFAKENQKEELSKHIAVLRRYQERQYALLGKLSRCTESFVEKSDKKSLDEWLLYFFALMRQIALSTGDSTIELSELFLQWKLFVETFDVRMRKAFNAIPGVVDTHFSRMWMRYGVAAVVTAGSFWATKRYSVPLGRAKESIQEYFENRGSDMKGLWEGINPFAERIDGSKIVKDSLKNAYDQMKLYDAQQTDDTKKTLIADGALIKEEEYMAFDPFSLVKQLGSSAAKFLSDKDALNKLLPKNTTGNVTIFQQLIDKISANLPEANSAEKGLLSLWWNPENKLNDQLVQLINTYIKPPLESLKGKNLEIPSMIEAQLSAITLGAEFKLKKGSRQIATLTAVTGVLVSMGLAYITGKTLYSFIKRKPHDFAPMRKALAEVDCILIAYDRSGPKTEITSGVTDVSWGKLLYYLHKIKQEAYYLPEAEKRDFEADVRQLSLESYFTIRQRRELIRAIRWKYGFLQLSDGLVNA